MLARAWPSRYETTFTGTPSASNRGAWVWRRSCSRITGSRSSPRALRAGRPWPRICARGDLAGESAGEPLGVPVGAVEVAEHQRRVAHELVREGTASRAVNPQGGDRVGVALHLACLAGSSAPRRAAGRRPWPHRTQAAPDLQPTGVEVHVPPAQGE